MPCHDVTEILRVELDQCDRIVFYSLSKNSCGGSVGKPSLLKRQVKNRTAQQVLALSPDELLRRLNLRSTTWEFLHVKHLLALQTGLRVLLGQQTARPHDFCTVDSIVHDTDRVKLTAFIHSDLLTEEISACGACDSCQPPSAN